MNILLLGSSGQLGHALQQALQGAGELTCLDRQALDLSLAQEADISTLFEQHEPHWVINASAYTAVDAAESDPDTAFHINAQVPEYLAKACSKHSAALVHYSTDFVFDGKAQTPYLEEDLCHPLSVYGESKWRGELAVQAHAPAHLIFRTAWLMGSFGGNFLKTILKLASSKHELKVIDDQFGAPTQASWLAHVTRRALDHLTSPLASPQIDPSHPHWGLYHASGLGQISWHQYARAVVEDAKALGFELSLTPEQVLPIASCEYPQPAQRPFFSVLNCDKLKQTFDIQPVEWRQSVQEVLNELQHC